MSTIKKLYEYETTVSIEKIFLILRVEFCKQILYNWVKK